jgi:DNA-directed RNA polymerase specialized sigma subunit
LARGAEDAERRALVDEVLAGFEPLVQKLASHYRHIMLPSSSRVHCGFSDFLQIARLAVVDACRTYDPERGAFATHVQWAIRDILHRTVESAVTTGCARLSTRQFRLRNRMRRLQGTLASTLARTPTAEDWCTATGAPARDVHAVLLYDSIDEGGVWEARTDAYQRTMVDTLTPEMLVSLREQVEGDDDGE